MLFPLRDETPRNYTWRSHVQLSGNSTFVGTKDSPPLDQAWTAFEDFLIPEERQEWQKVVNEVRALDSEPPVELKRRLSKAEQIEYKLRQIRNETLSESVSAGWPDMTHPALLVIERTLNILPAFKIARDDDEKVRSFESRVRAKWGPEKISIVHHYTPSIIPLLEVRAWGHWLLHTYNCLWLHTRNHTWQEMLPERLRRRPFALMSNEAILKPFIGDREWNGGLPRWDEEVMVESLEQAMAQHPTEVECDKLQALGKVTPFILGCVARFGPALYQAREDIRLVHRPMRNAIHRAIVEEDRDNFDYLIDNALANVKRMMHFKEREAQMNRRMQRALDPFLYI